MRPKPSASIAWCIRGAHRGREKGGPERKREHEDKCRQTLINAGKRRGVNASKRKQTQPNAEKHKRTLTPVLSCGFLQPPSPESENHVLCGELSGHPLEGNRVSLGAVPATLYCCCSMYQPESQASLCGF